MKKYKVIITAAVVSGICVLTGGILIKVLKDRRQKRVMTPEDLIDYYNLTEEETANVDLDKMLEEYKLTFEEARDAGFTKGDILKTLSCFPKIETKEEKIRDYCYLLNKDSLKGRKPDFQTMKYIAFQESDAEGYSVFIDVLSQKVYINPESWKYVFQDVLNAEVVLSNVNLTELIKGFEVLGMEDWKRRYEGNEMYGVSWSLGMEFEDGTIVSYSGYNGGPNNYSELRKLMFSLYSHSHTE